MAGEKAGEDRVLANGAKHIDFQTDPSRYRHWRIERAGAFSGADSAALRQTLPRHLQA